MITNISLVTVYCIDQDEARDFYVDVLGFRPLADVDAGEGFRWVTVGHPSQPELEVTLMTPGPPLEPSPAIGASSSSPERRPTRRPDRWRPFVPGALAVDGPPGGRIAAMTGLLALDDVREAHERIRGRVLHTPLVPYPPADGDRPLWLKAESLQPTGAFKIRGALNATLLALDQARRYGVVTHSSGNHGRAVAWVARELGVHATVVVPDAAPAVKVAAVRALGAEVVVVGPDERESRAAEVVAERGCVLVPPYDHPHVAAGQGTVALEILADLPDVDVVLVPVGGGGLIAGVAAVVKALRPATTVVGVEPELAADAAESLRTGSRVTWPSAMTYRTAADGLRVTRLGDIGWAHVQAHVDDVVTVGEEEIRAAMYALAVDARLVAEPSGAVTLAAYRHRRDDLPAGGRFVAVVSGGSVDPAVLADVLATGGART